MQVGEHLKSYCFFWKPSVARRVSFYFLIFGLIIFLITSALYTIAAKKQFVQSTTRLIQHQFSQLENSREADFIWSSINRKRPDLYRLLETLVNFSSSFYLISDISIYSKDTAGSSWYRLDFTDDQILRARPAEDAFIKNLDRSLRRHFRRSDVDFYSAEGTLSMFVDITREKDTNYYFLKIGAGGAGIGGIMKRQIIHLVVSALIALFILRFLGYYFARKIARPIENLSAVAADVARGDLCHTVPVITQDEFGKLAANFNKMIEGLREWERIKEIEFELEKGQKIQRDFLPSAIPHLPHWEIATCFYPAGKVSGDFYDVFMLPDQTVGLVIADVCDKGVGSALYMALFRSLIRVFAEQAIYCNAAAVDQIDQTCVAIGSASFPANEQMVRLRAVPFTNNYIAQTHGDESMFATLFFGVLNPSSGMMYYINGGHEPLYVINSSGIKMTLKPTGPAVGMMPDSRCNVQQINLEPGDVLVGYTDGVTEARSPEDQPFSRARLLSLFEQPFISASDLLERVKNNLFAFIDMAPRNDDVTMVAVQRAPR
ncbi:MAG: SpoIIE family protein phosphatase [Desulfobacterales bacterium]|nr:MAG: SpoIIE family protein phosphatase [Desulfobacterales bacterium]